MTKRFRDEEVRKYILIGSALIGLFWLLTNLQGILGILMRIISIIMPFIIGGAIAFVLNVPMKKIEKHILRRGKLRAEKYAGMRRICAFLLTLVILILILFVITFVIIPQLASTVAELIKAIPDGVTNLIDWLTQKLAAYPQVGDKLASISINWDSLLTSAVDFISSGTKGIIQGGIGAVSGIVSGIVTFFIGIIFAIYILLQKEKLARQSKKVLYALASNKTADKVIEIASLTSNTFESFLSGQCLEAMILGSMFCVTMLIIGLPYAFLEGMVICLAALIPILGSFIGCAVGILLIALVSPVKVIVFIIMFLVLQQIEGNLIYPHVVGNSVGLPGMWVLVAVTVGGSLFGIPGILIFIPMSSVCYALFRRFINRKFEQKQKDAGADLDEEEL